jgi:hypothetical protein
MMISPRDAVPEKTSEGCILFDSQQKIEIR